MFNYSVILSRSTQGFLGVKAIQESFVMLKDKDGGSEVIDNGWGKNQVFESRCSRHLVRCSRRYIAIIILKYSIINALEHWLFIVGEFRPF